MKKIDSKPTENIHRKNTGPKQAQQQGLKRETISI